MSRNPTHRLSPAEDLDLAVRSIGELNRTIAAADTKAGLLLTATGFLLSGLVAVTRTPSPQCWLTAIGVVPVLLALLMCAGFLVSTLRPTLRGANEANWFSFPDFPTAVSHRPDLRDLADQAWRQVALLTAIARRKHRAVAVAVGWGGTCLAAFLFWLAAILLIPTP